eukprot:2549652-Prymnesium_polylepis.2
MRDAECAHDVLGVRGKALLVTAIAAAVLRPEPVGRVHPFRRFAQQRDQPNLVGAVDGAAHKKADGRPGQAVRASSSWACGGARPRRCAPHEPGHREAPLPSTTDALLPAALRLARLCEASPPCLSRPDLEARAAGGQILIPSFVEHAVRRRPGEGQRTARGLAEHGALARPELVQRAQRNRIGSGTSRPRAAAIVAAAPQHALPLRARVPIV